MAAFLSWRQCLMYLYRVCSLVGSRWAENAQAWYFSTADWCLHCVSPFARVLKIVSRRSSGSSSVIVLSSLDAPTGRVLRSSSHRTSCVCPLCHHDPRWEGDILHSWLWAYFRERGPGLPVRSCLCCGGTWCIWGWPLLRGCSLAAAFPVAS